MKKIIIIALAFLILAFSVGGFAAYKRWAVPAYAGPDQSMIATEEALVTPEMLLLASFDIEYLRTLDVKLNGTPRLPDLVTPDTEDEPTSVPDQVRRSLAREYDDLKYVTMAVYLTKEKGPSIMIVSGGNLRQEKALAFLKNYPNAKPAPGLPNAWIVQGEDPETCALSKEWTIMIDDNRIIATDAGDPGLIERVRGSSRPSRDLTLWREFRKERFAGAALFIPESLPSQGIDPLTNAIAANAQKQLIDFDALYLGASAIPFPARGEFALWLSAKSPAIAEQKATDWKTTLAASRKNWQTTLPTLAALHDRAHIRTRGNLVLADVNFDKELSGQLRDVAGEFIGLLFKGFDTKQITEPDKAAQEMIDNNPVKFIDAVSPDDIKPYDPKTTFADQADVTAGPFGIYLSAVRMTGAGTRTTELEIAAKGTGLPNLVDGREDAVELIVQSVKNRGERELLRAERCGPDRNGRPGKGRKLYGFPVVEVKKTVRLDEAAAVNDVARIEGTIRMRLPSRIEAVTLKAPKTGDHFDRDKTRIEVTRVGKNDISYRVSGDTTRLLLVRGKNAKGQVLLGAGSSSTQTLGGALSANQEFRGEASSVEFVLARTVEEKTFPFTLENAFPRATERDTRPQPLSISRYSHGEFKRDLAKQFQVERIPKAMSTAHAGPVVIDLDQIQAFFTMGLNFSVYLPVIRNIEGTLTAVEIGIDSMKLADGTLERPSKEKPWHAFVPIRRSGNNPYVNGFAQIDTALKGARPETVQALTGHVTLHVAAVPRTGTIDGTLLGREQNSPCGMVSVSEISRSGMTIEGRNNQECLYAVRALNAGQDLFVTNQRIRKTETGWAVDFGTSGQAERVEVIAALKKHTVNYPFVLKIEKSSKTDRQ